MARSAPSVKRAQRVLSICSLALLALGVFNLLPIPGIGPNLLFVLPVIVGVTGVLGLTFTWYKALVLFSIFAWVTLAINAWKLIDLARHDQANIFGWAMWIGCALFVAPAALLSTTLHAACVWRLRPLVGEQTAPLVDPTATESGGGAATTGAMRVSQAAVPPPAPAPTRPMWPPPNAPIPSVTDVASATRVADAAHFGDPRSLRPGDLAAAGRVAGAAAAVWPPPGSAR